MKNLLMKLNTTSRMVCYVIFLLYVITCVLCLFSSGLRCVKPYYFTFTSHAKGRWVGFNVYDVFCKEFQAESPEYYVSMLCARNFCCFSLSSLSPLSLPPLFLPSSSLSSCLSPLLFFSPIPLSFSSYPLFSPSTLPPSLATSLTSWKGIR